LCHLDPCQAEADGEGERERERERSERREAERKKAGAGATWSPAGRPNPFSASKVQVSYLAAAAAELYSLLEAFSWTNVAAGCIQLGGEASHVSNSCS